MSVKITLDLAKIKALEDCVIKSAELTMEQVKQDLISSATMPFDTGNMQNGGTYVSAKDEPKNTVKGNEVIKLSTDSEIHIALTNDAPQARRLYYHPEYNFQQGKNENAGAEWLEPYLTGDKKEFVKDTFEEIFKKRSGV